VRKLDRDQYKIFIEQLTGAGYTVKHVYRDAPLDGAQIKALEGVKGRVFVVVGWHGLQGGVNGSFRVKCGSTVYASHMGHKNLLVNWIMPRLQQAKVVGVYFDSCWAGQKLCLPDRYTVQCDQNEIAAWTWGIPHCDARGGVKHRAVSIAGPVNDPLVVGSWRVITEVAAAAVRAV
jgi:hypothetical protein